MPFPTYSSGTVSVAAAGTLVTGSGTYWSRAHARAGDLISIDGEPWVPIISVGDIDSPEDTQELTITEWQGAAKAGAQYIIAQTSIDRVLGRLAFEDIHGVVAALNASGYEIVVHSEALEPDPSDGQDGQYAFQPSTGKRWVMEDGVWEYLGTFAPVTMYGEWLPDVTYPINAIVTRNGKSYYAKRVTLGDPPESSPDDWGIFVDSGDRYDIAIFDTDRPASGEKVAKWVAPGPVTFRAALPESSANADVAATGSATFSLRKQGVQFATFTFTASANAVFACPADTTFAADDVMDVIAPAPRDETLAGVAATIVGYRT